jgi:hypothetical protein
VVLVYYWLDATRAECRGGGCAMNDRKKQDRRELQEIIYALTNVRLTGEQLDLRIVQIVQDANDGRLDHHDSLILGEFAVRALRNCL